MVAAADLTGIRFGKLVCLHRVPSQNGHARWLCKCDCGETHGASATALKMGSVAHCGCSSRKKKHGLSGTRLSRIHSAMKQRCQNPRSTEFHNYGGRGIAVCSEWRDSLESFASWAFANGYRDDLEIDRIDVNGPYGPENCRFVTSSQNKRNMRHTVILSYCGERISLHDLAERVGMSPRTLRSRLYTQKMDVETAVTLPRNVWATRRLRAQV